MYIWIWAEPTFKITLNSCKFESELNRPLRLRSTYVHLNLRWTDLKDHAQLSLFSPAVHQLQTKFESLYLCIFMVVTLEFLNEQNSLKYPRSTTLGCKDKGRKSVFAAKIPLQSLKRQFYVLFCPFCNRKKIIKSQLFSAKSRLEKKIIYLSP